MLQAIRDRVTGIVAIFILGLLAIPFVFFGMESYTRSVPQDAVASVDGEDISTGEFQTSFAEYRTQMREQMGDAYDETAMNELSVRREHLEGMIDQKLLRRHAESLGIEVSEREIAQIIRSVPAFQIAGEFDPQTYRQLLAARGRSPREFQQELREDMMVRALPASISESSIVTPFEAERMLALQQEARGIRYLEIPGTDFEDEVEVSEEDIERFYEENQSDYLTTERVALEYVEIDAEALVPDTEVSEEELRRQYDAAQARYISPERRRASHILLEVTDERDEEETEALANELKERLEEGEDFAELAEEYSDDVASRRQGGEIGMLEPGDMVSSFETPLYNLRAPGDLAGPVETGYGWHIIRLDEIREPEGMSFEEARDEILEEYREEQAERLFVEFSDRMIDLVYADPTSLEPVADDLGLEIRRTELFDRSGGEGIAADREVIDAAFSDLVLLEGSTSDPIDLGRNHMVAVRVVEHEPAEPRPLETVAEEIRERIKRQRGMEMAEERARELMARVHDEGLDLEALAEESGYELATEDAVTRQSFQLGSDFLQGLFRLPAPEDESTMHVMRKGGAWVVMSLEEVRPGDPLLVQDQLKDSIRQQLQFGYTGYEFAGLMEYLRDESRIRIVEDRL